MSHSSHGHGCGGHHHHDEQDPAILFSLYKKIDLTKVQCLNEAEDGSGKEVFKAWERRLDKDKVRILISENLLHLHVMPVVRGERL